MDFNLETALKTADQFFRVLAYFVLIICILIGLIHWIRAKKQNMPLQPLRAIWDIFFGTIRSKEEYIVRFILLEMDKSETIIDVNYIMFETNSGMYFGGISEFDMEGNFKLLDKTSVLGTKGACISIIENNIIKRLNKSIKFDKDKKKIDIDWHSIRKIQFEIEYNSNFDLVGSHILSTEKEISLIYKNVSKINRRNKVGRRKIENQGISNKSILRDN